MLPVEPTQNKHLGKAFQVEMSTGVTTAPKKIIIEPDMMRGMREASREESLYCYVCLCLLCNLAASWPYIMPRQISGQPLSFLGGPTNGLEGRVAWN